MFMNAFEFGLALFFAVALLGGRVYEKMYKED